MKRNYCKTHIFIFQPHAQIISLAPCSSGSAVPSSVPEAAEMRQLPIICLTSKASPEDLRSYMAAGMDGCVSKPVEPGALLNTLRSAIPLHLSPASSIDGRPLVATDRDPEGGVDVKRKSSDEKVLQGRGVLGLLKGSAVCAARGMALPLAREDGSVEGALQVLLVPVLVLALLSASHRLMVNPLKLY